MSTPNFLTVKEAATWLNIDVNTLRAWLTQRRLRFYRLGRKIVLKEDDLQKYVDENCVEAIEIG